MTLASAVSLQDVLDKCIEPALKLFPPYATSDEARVMLLAIGLQESGFRDRYQVLENGRKGPARGFWQFERGSRSAGGGVWGVYKHPVAKVTFKRICEARGQIDDPSLVWGMLEYDDLLAAAIARLLLWTDAKALPKIGDHWGAWECYQRNWRPGRPHPDRWGPGYARAVEAVQ